MNFWVHVCCSCTELGALQGTDSSYSWFLPFDASGQRHVSKYIGHLGKMWHKTRCISQWVYEGIKEKTSTEDNIKRLQNKFQAGVYRSFSTHTPQAANSQATTIFVTLNPKDWHAFSGFRYACDVRITTPADIMTQWPENTLWLLQCQQRIGMHHLLAAQPEHITYLLKLHSTCLFLSKEDIVHNFKDWWEGEVTHTVKALTAEELLRLSSALHP